MRVLVVGASRGSGAAVARELAGRGHLVTGFARSALPDDVAVLHDRVSVGPAMATDDDRVVGMSVGRDQVAVAITDALAPDSTVGATLSISAS